MKDYKKAIWQIIIVSIWINIAETLRWVFFTKDYFIKHYQDMNLVLPFGPLYLVLWLIWGILLSVMIFIISKKFTILQTTFIIWLMAFFMVWITLFNMNALPVSILWLVVPLSFISILVGVLISKYFHNKVKN
jgi:hypothetical protein